MEGMVYDPKQQEPCGCPKDKFRFSYRCRLHALPRQALPKSPAARGPHGDWYRRNTCPACERVVTWQHPDGMALFCDTVSHVNGCHLVTCGGTSRDHEMAHFRLGTTCPAETPRKRGRKRVPVTVEYARS